MLDYLFLSCKDLQLTAALFSAFLIGVVSASSSAKLSQIIEQVHFNNLTSKRNGKQSKVTS